MKQENSKKIYFLYVKKAIKKDLVQNLCNRPFLFEGIPKEHRLLGCGG